MTGSMTEKLWERLSEILKISDVAQLRRFLEQLSAPETARAVFLRMISDMSVCSRNQAVAVSMREWALGLIRPNEILRIIGWELGLGTLNGLGLGLLLGSVALLWKGNPFLGLVVGAALTANTMLTVTFGVFFPLFSNL
jgi:magnesium transporter